MTTAYIGIGSNLGNRKENCEIAIKHLKDRGINILTVSPAIETEPWGVEEQPKFINMAIEVETDLSPEGLLILLKKLEEIMGRTQTVRWGPRLIDLDILFYNDLVMKSAELEIPHPRIQHRDFVLRPLAEIAPDLLHPVFKKSIQEMLDAL